MSARLQVFYEGNDVVVVVVAGRGLPWWWAAQNEKVSALMTEEHLAGRARRGSRKEFGRALNKVADVEPEEDDQL